MEIYFLLYFTSKNVADRGNGLRHLSLHEAGQLDYVDSDVQTTSPSLPYFF